MPNHPWPRLAALACALTLAGCGSDAAPPAAAPSTVAPPSTTRAAVAATPTVDPYAGVPLIEDVEWTTAVDGARLLVYPTTAGRRTSYPGSDDRAWQEVVDAAPDANSPGMRDQFICHWVWARLVQPDKPSWNLEPWRPAVGYQATVDASCNPGGPER
ncbi:DUF2599 domain-containing protein [Nocardia sp. NPDC048505]|uniref:DUF2599 domain-containing protein n=1 Tax=Nocardia sp. NPDC048505 TaxID=3155756 RepID=UPI0033F00AE5